MIIPETPGVRADLLKNIAPLVQTSIAMGHYPGAVILAGHRGHIMYQGVFGNRRLLPDVAPMRFDTIFDIASLTKVVATAPAIMQLIEEGKLELDARVAKYWPAFAANGKGQVTVRQLLTHTSGLPAEIHFENSATKLTALQKIKLRHTPGTKFLYSDVDFIVLAHLVEILSGKPFDRYVKQHIFQPLTMTDTFFLPSKKMRERIAPTEMIHHHLYWGEVHDPTAQKQQGVSGNAGLFSTAHDLGLYAQSLLNGGKTIHEKYFLSPLAISKMTTVQTPKFISETRGLGWDIDSAYANRGVFFPVHSFGHTGWTGTSLWIDPVTQTWVVILTSRTHPTPAHGNPLKHDRNKIANIISASLTDVSQYTQNNTSQGELNRAFAHHYHS